MLVVASEDTIRRERGNILIRFQGQNVEFCQPEALRDGMELPARYASPSTPDVLFADLSIPAVGYCLNHGIKFGYWLEGRVFDRGSLKDMDERERMLVACGNYAALKEFNILRMSLEAANRQTVLQSLPTHMQLEHTTYCNARCIMCDHFVAHNRGARHLSMDTVRYLEDIFPYLSLVVMHGNGEPFLNPDILELIGLYKKYGIRVSTNTNLSFLNDELANELNGICDSLQVSCDGCTKEVYEGIRQGLCFELFCANLKKVASLRGIRRLSLEVVLMQQNIQYAADFVRFAAFFGIQSVHFHDLGVNSILGSERYSVHAVPDLALRNLESAREEGTRLGVEVRGFPLPPVDHPRTAHLMTQFPEPEVSRRLHETYGWYTNVIAFQNMRQEDLTASGNPYSGICEYPFAKTYIDVSGGVSVCCPFSRRRVGLITAERGFSEIWNGESMRTIRGVFYGGKLPQFCKGCFMLEENTLQWLKK